MSNFLFAGIAAAALAAISRAAQANTNPSTPTPDAGGDDTVRIIGELPNYPVQDSYLFNWSYEVDVLARTIYAENSGGGWTGMQSVANTIMNRVYFSEQNGGYWWGNDVPGVCLKRSGNSYQYDCWRPGTSNYVRQQSATPNDPAFAMALEIAVRAVSGQLPDITRGATHYYAPAVVSAPAWSRNAPVLANIEGHLFYAVA